MKRLLTVVAAIVILALGGSAFAAGISATTHMGPGGKRFAVGGYMSMGMALAAGDGIPEMYGVDESDEFARFAGGGGVYFDFFFTRMVGLETGLGFLGKGTRLKGEINVAGFSDDFNARMKIIYMEIPIAVKLNIRNFRLSLGIGLWFALSGKTVSKDGGTKTTHDFDGDDWEEMHRVNIGPRFAVGYAIPVGPVSIVPSVTWMFHLVNDLDNDSIPGNEEYSARAMNIMFNVGAEFGF